VTTKNPEILSPIKTQNENLYSDLTIFKELLWSTGEEKYKFCSKKPIIFSNLNVKN
jgi:hypothetical protein